MVTNGDIEGDPKLKAMTFSYKYQNAIQSRANNAHIKSNKNPSK
jgi:hypothetical protein